MLARDPKAAKRPGGPCDAEPLWTLCFSNLGLGIVLEGEKRAAIGQALLGHGADPNASATKPSDFGPFRASALYGTIARNQPLLTKLLLEVGADPNDGESLYHATEHRDARCLRLLLAGGARPAATHALHHALDYADPEPARLLLEAGADPNEFGTLGYGPLHHAARRGRGVAAIDLLLRHGAALDLLDAKGRTAYAIARRLGARETAEHLLARGASPELPDADVFLAACAGGDESAARAMLARDPGLLTRLSEEERGVLAEAARYDRLDAVRVMLDVGFPLEATGGDYPGTALNHAAFGAYPELVELLLARGADPELENHFGGTALGALCWASRHFDGVDMRDRSEEERERDRLRSAELLLAAGARIRPQHVANASPALAELLREHGGADPED
jgi:ankyrin repeat protein